MPFIKRLHFPRYLFIAFLSHISWPYQSSSVAQSCLIFATHGLQHLRLPCLSPALKLGQTHVHWVGDAIQPSHPLLLHLHPTLNLSQHQGLFQVLSSLHQVAKLFGGQRVSASASLLPMNIQDWFPLGFIAWISWAVQGTLKILTQYHSSKASILWHSVFFIIQLSHPCMTTGKNIALTRWTFVGKVMSLFLILRLS